MDNPEQFSLSDVQMSGLMTRRRLIKGAFAASAVAVIPGVLAACGGGGSTTTSAGGTTTGGASGGTVGGTLDYIGWQGEDFKEVLGPWYKEHGVKVKSSYIGNMSDIAAKYAAGGGEDFDVICFSSNGTTRLIESGVPLVPLDFSKIPNFKNMPTFWQEDVSLQNENGDVVAVPTTWGALGISYDSKSIDAPTAWADLLEPQFKGKITVIDDPSTCFGLACPLVTGHSAHEMTQDEFDEVKEYLAEVIAQAKQLAPSFGDMANLLASGDVIAAWGSLPSINTFAAEAGNRNIKTQTELKDGSATYTECYGIPETAQNTATAYAMINELMSTPVLAEVANFLILPPTVEAARRKVKPEVLELFPQGEKNIEKYIEKNPIAIDPPAQSSEFVNFGEVTQGWNEVKAGVGA